MPHYCDARIYRLALRAEFIVGLLVGPAMLPKARLLRSHMRNARLRLRKSGKLDRIKPIANHRWRIVRGDKVEVIKGPDNGKQGTVLLVDRKLNRVYVEEANMTLMQLPDDSDPSGYRRVEHEAPMHVSNVMLVDPVLGVRTKVGFRYLPVDEDGKRIEGAEGSEAESGAQHGHNPDQRMKRFRIAKKSGTVLEPNAVLLKDYQTARGLQKERGAGSKDTLPEDVLEQTFQGLRLDEQWREARAEGIGARGTTPVFDKSWPPKRRRKAAAEAARAAKAGSGGASGGGVSQQAAAAAAAAAEAEAAEAEAAAADDAAPPGAKGDEDGEKSDSEGDSPAKAWWQW